MNDEAAASRGPATTGTGSPQDEPAPSLPPAPEAPTAAEDDGPTAWTPPADGAPPADDPPPPPPPPGATAPPWFGAGGATFSREQLVRPAKGRYVAGVCAAIGRATNTDPVLWRVLIVVLGFSGVGVLVYLIGWLGIRGEGDAVSPVESVLGRGRSALTPLSVVLLGAAAVAAFAFVVQSGFRATLLGAAVVVGVALLIRRGGGQEAAGPGATEPGATEPGAAFPFAPMDRTEAFAAAGAPAGATATGGPATTTAPAGEPMSPPPPRFSPAPPGDYRPPFAPHGPFANQPPPPPPSAVRGPKPPKPPRERSKLGRITFFAVLMVLGVLALFDVAGVSVAVSAYFAAALATIAVGLLVGGWFGRARGLIALALLATAGLFVSAGVERFGGQVANSDYHPQNISQVADRYDFSLGNATLDLRAVDFTGVQQDTVITMNAGQVKVLLPDQVDTTASVTMNAGRAVVFGTVYEGDSVNALNVQNLGADGAGGGTLRLNLQVKTGNVEVAR